MAKSNRRRKLDRAKRQVRDAQRQVVAGRRLADEQAIQDAKAHFERLVEPGTSVAELVCLLNEEFGGNPVPPYLVNWMLFEESSQERLAEAAEAMLASGGGEESAPSLTALTFAAEVARVEGNAGRSLELLDQALALGTDNPERQMVLVDHLRVSSRLADCLSLLEGILRDAPDDNRAAESYGRAIQEAYGRVTHQEPSEQCLCGRGASWQECCGPRERAALDRFTDRSDMTAISDAVAAFLTNSEYGRVIDDKVADFVADYDDLEWNPDGLASSRELLAEHALLTAKLPADDLDEDGQEAGEAIGALAAFAADLSVPRELAAKADKWREHIHYGLWRIDDRSAAPGLWCTDICSGVVRYAEFPAWLTDGWPRWSVWLGGLVPVDGVWRATGAGLRLSPAEADAVAEFVDDASVSLADAVAGKQTRSTQSAERIPFGSAGPTGVLVDWREPARSDVASVIGVVVGYLLPRIVGELHLHRWTPPALRNGDGDEMCLIAAEIAVNDSEQVLDRLSARPGFERDPDDPQRVNWYGMRIPEAQQKAMQAGAMVRPGAFWLAGTDIEDQAEPERWPRGRVSVGVGVGQISAQVNSDKLLARLLDVFSKIGAAPAVTNEIRVDPAQYLTWSGESARARDAGPLGEAWEKYWLDEQVPALGWRTPREASTANERLVLEALLRQFEHESDVLVAEGQRGIDTDWLRQELDMADETGV